jgi:hypothetical protein
MLILSLLNSIARAVISLVALAMRIFVSKSDWLTSRPGAECSYSKTVVLPIDALIAKLLFARKLKLLNIASGMLKFDELAASVGGGRIGPGGGHRVRAVGMRKERAAMVKTSILDKKREREKRVNKKVEGPDGLVDSESVVEQR